MTVKTVVTLMVVLDKRISELQERKAELLEKKKEIQDEVGSTWADLPDWLTQELETIRKELDRCIEARNDFGRTDVRGME